jgi:glycosyl transferase family 25
MTRPMNPNPAVFVISLPSSTERRAKIRERLDLLNMEFEFVDGIDLRGADITSHPDYDGLRRRLFFGRDLAPGELGCLLSHRKVYQIMTDRAIPHALVLEDDAGLEDDLPQVLRTLLGSPLAWDLIRFLDKKKVYRKKCRRIGMIDATHELSRLPTNSGGAYGYLLNLRAATRLRKLMEHNWLQNDALHSRAWMTGLITYILRPSPVTHPTEDDDSTIGNARFDTLIQVSGWQRIVHPVARFGMKLQDMVMKRLHLVRSLHQDSRNRKLADPALNPRSAGQNPFK